MIVLGFMFFVKMAMFFTELLLIPISIFLLSW